VRAIQVSRFGGPEVLEPVELPDPVPGPVEVVVRNEAVDTIFVETNIRQGFRAAQFGIEPPYVPGGAAAGTVVAIGSDVPEHWLGRRVLAGAGNQAAYAEFMRAGLMRAWPVPDEVDLRTAAALGHDGVTALGLLQGIGLSPGERVLILGAAGGMGVLLVQLATAAGAHVVGTARGETKLALVRKLGAAAVDYSRPGWVDAVREVFDGRPVDVLLDGVGGALGSEGVGLVANGGRVSAHGAASGQFVSLEPEFIAEHHLSVRGIADLQFGAADRARLGSAALEAAAQGRLRPAIGLELPLERAAEVHRAIAAREVPGKALLIP
jgi:NADPH:quinone reductase